MKAFTVRVALVIAFAQTIAFAQDPSSTTPELRYDRGTISNGIYSNTCLGFSLSIPDGWKIDNSWGGSDANGYATQFPGGGLGLLTIFRQPEQPFKQRLAVVASDATHATVSVRESVDLTVQKLIDSDPQHREILKEAFPVNYGAKQFFRSDYKMSMPKGDLLFHSNIYTSFRNFFLGFRLIAGSQQELDETAKILGQMTFMEGAADARCIVGKPLPLPPGMVVGVVGSSRSGPNAGSGTGAPSQVKVSQAVSRALLMTNPNPPYPEEAHRARVQGSVVLRVVVGKYGDVEEVTLISGDPLLAPASIAAVKTWKYRSYFLNQQPVKMETTVTLDFKLPNL